VALVVLALSAAFCGMVIKSWPQSMATTPDAH